LLTFWNINHKKIKGKECIHVTNKINKEINHGSQNVLEILTWIGGY
jgi:hypothetical protein